MSTKRNMCMYEYLLVHVYVQVPTHRGRGETTLSPETIYVLVLVHTHVPVGTCTYTCSYWYSCMYRYLLIEGGGDPLSYHN
jgi:hypothetical protein